MTTPNDQPLTEEEITRLQTAWMGHRDFQNELFRSGKALPPREQERLNNVLAAHESYAIESLPRLLSELRHLRGIVEGAEAGVAMLVPAVEAARELLDALNELCGKGCADYRSGDGKSETIIHVVDSRLWSHVLSYGMRLNGKLAAIDAVKAEAAALAHPTDSGGGLNLDAKENA